MIQSIKYPKKKNQLLILPTSYSNKLAEETGIHIGDGSMNLYKGNRYGDYSYSGHAVDDKEFGKYFIELMKRLYNLWPSYERIQKKYIDDSLFQN